MINKIIISFLFLVGFNVYAFCQILHIDYIQTEGNFNKFTFEVWISNSGPEEIKLSALNTVFNYPVNNLEYCSVEFQLAPKFNELTSPNFTNLVSKNKIRSTMVPVTNATKAIKVSKSPELFGTMSVLCDNSINYPVRLIPSTIGSPNLQANIYINESINSRALALSHMTIRTNDNPLVLKLMSNKINVSQTWDGVDIYPNPTTNFLTIDINNIVDEQKTIVNLLDIQGRVAIYGDYSGQQKVKLDVTNLSSGIYYITVQNGENIFREKIIKID